MKKQRSVLKNVLFILLLLVIAGLISVPIIKDINFGLDLAGGFEILYRVDSVDGKEVTSDMVTSTYKTMLRRIDSLGVSEPNIIVEGDRNIRVQLAGVTDSKTAREILSKAANLTFRDTNDNLLATASVLKSGGARVSQDANGNPAVSLAVKDKDTFYKMTKKVSQMDNNQIVIWLDFEDGNSYSTEASNCGNLDSSKCLSAATVSQGFADDVIIQGDFETEEVTKLVELINSGSLPTKLEEISSKNVSASFGENSLNKTLVAGIIGIALIMVFLIAIYRFAGAIASASILLYAAVTLFVFWLIGGVLTLPGIAALVIGIGMAVDANVITFSRIKDELRKGNKLPAAYRNGNKDSFWTIFDSNFTTLIVAVILFIFGESSIKGFATMLIISTIVTMFIMVVLSRFLLTKFINTKYFNDHLNFFIGYKDSKNNRFSKISFIKKRGIYYILSLLIVIVGTISLAFNGLNLGIDFKGGTAITINSEAKLSVEEIQKDINNLDYTVAQVDQIDDETISLKVEETLTKKEINEIEKHFKEQYNASTDIGVVSNVVKEELIKNAVLSLALAAVGIIIYVSFRFTFNYAITGLIALLHDVFFIFALFSIFKLEVSSIFVAAVLSIIGYSINDTIVTFDRIKENMNAYKGKIKDKTVLAEIVNDSLRETLGRSIITTITTLIPVVCLILFGAYEIINFNIALLFGLISGVYSSLFIASQLWYDIESKKINSKNDKKEKRKKVVEELNVKGINS